MLPAHHQNEGQNHNIKTMNKQEPFFKNAVTFKYLGMTVTYQNLVHQEIKIRLNPWDAGNASYN